MTDQTENISKRKKEHIELCLTDKVSFQNKNAGFENYDFIHNAITEIDINKISFRTKFFNKSISFPFLISCMTGGTEKAENINSHLAEVAEKLNIPIGVGSQRSLLESDNYKNSFKIIRKKAKLVPVIGNIGAAQIANLKSINKIQYLIDIIEADAMVIHLNPLQELHQKNGDLNFKGLLKNILLLCNKIKIPFIVKEVGSGISYDAAKKLLDAGVKGIDVAGSGGTSWAGVEILRNKESNNNYFWDWGIPTTYCLRTVNKLKKKNNFILIGSGGINNGVDIAKAIALGADITASARIILQTLDKNGNDGVINLINDWFETVRKIMFLTGSKNLNDLRKNKLIRRSDFY